MNKASIRKDFLKKRAELNKAEFERLNTLIFEQFKQLDLSGVKVLHAFLPISGKHEIDTWPIINWLWKQHPNITTVAPKADFKAAQMQHHTLTSETVLVTNAYGISEPENSPEVVSSAIDMVLVPLLAFDLRGYRVGYGKGFYDHFLSGCRKDVITIGLSQFSPIETIEDIDVWDHPLMHVIAPENVYSFGFTRD